MKPISQDNGNGKCSFSSLIGKNNLPWWLSYIWIRDTSALLETENGIMEFVKQIGFGHQKGNYKSENPEWIGPTEIILPSTLQNSLRFIERG